MLDISVKVGGLPVLAAGSFVANVKDGNTTLVVSGLEIEFEFASEGQSRHETLPNGVKLILAGFDNPLGRKINFAGGLELERRPLELSIVVHALVDNTDPSNTSRLVSYTLK